MNEIGSLEKFGMLCTLKKKGKASKFLELEKVGRRGIKSFTSCLVMRYTEVLTKQIYESKLPERRSNTAGTGERQKGAMNKHHMTIGKTLTNSMSYGTRRSNAAFTRALQ